MAKKSKSKKCDGSEFQVWAYSGHMTHDDAICKAAQTAKFGSGYGPEGRDISFFAKTEADAFAMKDRLLQLSCVRMVEIYYPNGIRTFENRKKPEKSKWLTCG